MTVLGVGVDLLRVDRIRGILDGPARDGFVSSTFTDDEARAAERHGDPAVAFTTRFAIKEAVFKCFHVGFVEGDRLRDIEVHEDPVGAPHVTLSGRFAELLAEGGAAPPLVSVSFDDELVMAVAVLTACGSAGGP